MDWTHKLRLRNLQMLLSLAETGNMSHSAEALHTTQPGLSKWLKELEEEVGLPLFERHARGLRPTSYGKALIDHARRIEAHLDAAREDMSSMRLGGAGIVLIGFAGVSAVDTVPIAVLRIVQKIPNVHVKLFENNLGNLMNALNSGEMDIVVGPSDFSGLPPRVRAETLYAESIHAVARKDHPIFGVDHITWSHVLSYPWALWAKGTPVRRAFDRALEAAGHKPPVHYVESNSAALNTALLLHSDMIGVTSQRPAIRWGSLNLLSVIPLPLGVLGAVSVYWREDSISRLAVKAALDSIRETGRDASGGDLFHGPAVSADEYGR